MRLYALLLALALASAVALACATFGQRSLQLLLDYTRYLSTARRFDAFVVLRLGASTHLLDHLEQTLQREFHTPLVTLCGRKPSLQLCEFLSSNLLVFVLMPSLAHFDADVRDFGLTERHGVPMIFLAMDTPPINRQELQSFFSWCWQLNIINALLLYERVDGEYAPRVYSYSPFPTLHIVNLTLAPYADYHPNKLHDLQGFVFNVRIFNDPPMVLTIGRWRTGRQLSGIAGLMFGEYVHRLNATYNVELERGAQEATRERNALLAPSRKLTHIGINPFTSVVEYAKGIKASYPIFLTRVCVLVPVLPAVPPCAYLPMVFQLLTAYLLLAGLVVVVLLHRLLNCAQARVCGHVAFGVFLSNVIKSLLSQAITRRRSHSAMHRVILLMATTFGMVWTYTIVATLTSYFTAEVPARQILTVADLLASCFQIMVPEYDRLTYFESHLLPDALRSRLYVVDSRTAAKHRGDLNTSYAYVATSIKWNHINMRQRRLWHMRHTIASDELCSPILPESWPLQQDSPFEDTLTVFTLQMHAYGLLEKFERISGSRTQWFNSFLCDDYEAVQALTFDHLLMAFSLLATCAVIASVVFVGELLWHRLRLRQRLTWCGGGGGGNDGV